MMDPDDRENPYFHISFNNAGHDKANIEYFNYDGWDNRNIEIDVDGIAQVILNIIEEEDNLPELDVSIEGLIRDVLIVKQVAKNEKKKLEEFTDTNTATNPEASSFNPDLKAIAANLGVIILILMGVGALIYFIMI